MKVDVKRLLMREGCGGDSIPLEVIIGISRVKKRRRRSTNKIYSQLFLRLICDLTMTAIGRK